MAKDVFMPALGMAQETGTVVEWLKAEGEAVVKGEPLIIVGTDKSDAEVEATASGTLAAVSAQAGDEVAVGSVIAQILGPGEKPTLLVPKLASPAESAADPETDSAPELASGPEAASAPVAVSPLAARIAADNDVDLKQVSPAGARIRKSDVLAYLAAGEADRGAARLTPASPKARRLAAEAGIALADIVGSGPQGAVLVEDVARFEIVAPVAQPQRVDAQAGISETIPVGRAWRIMAQRLQESWTSVPHFYLEREVDASALLAWQQAAQRRIEEKVTVTDLMVKMTASALRDHPRLNAAWIDDNIQGNGEINVGLAVAVDDGLLVPVIHRADQLGLAQIGARRAEVVRNAQEGRLSVDDMSGGTFTISNLGMFGVSKFSAIVNPPQAAILAVGAIGERVVAVEGAPVVRPMFSLTLSCDHRVVDGARGARFLGTLVDYLEEPLSLLE